jgi:hypothetical protein
MSDSSRYRGQQVRVQDRRLLSFLPFLSDSLREQVFAEPVESEPQEIHLDNMLMTAADEDEDCINTVHEKRREP